MARRSKAYAFEILEAFCFADGYIEISVSSNVFTALANSTRSIPMRYSFAAVAVVLTMTCWTACVCQAQITATERAQQGVTTALKELPDAELLLKVAKARVDRSVQSTPEYS